jgi:hypothetical protein
MLESLPGRWLSADIGNTVLIFAVLFHTSFRTSKAQKLAATQAM